MKVRLYPLFILVMASLAAAAGFAGEMALTETCESVARDLNRSLTPGIDAEEMVSILRTLNETGNRKLPQKFVTKNQARKLGWKPGRDLWEYRKLMGKSIGGDTFGNREGKLPDGERIWREADLDYKGGRRGPKRIVYSNDGLRMITVDHYRTFREVPPCQ